MNLKVLPLDVFLVATGVILRLKDAVSNSTDLSIPSNEWHQQGSFNVKLRNPLRFRLDFGCLMKSS